MTRRRPFARRPLSMQAYIQRATLGLPRAERLDAAAELRTHLVEQTDKLRAAGHPADEAEYLAVGAMGDPAPTNRGLLGHAFTHRAGWAVLAAVLLGGGIWVGYRYVQREWLPPREGLRYTGSALSLGDLTVLNTDKDAPRGIYQTALLTYPKGTRTIYYALITPHNASIQTKDVAGELAENLKAYGGRNVPGSYRYQERWLMTEMRSDTVCPGHWEFYVNFQVVSGTLLPAINTMVPGLSDLQQCSGVQRRFTTFPLTYLKPGSYDSTEKPPTETVQKKIELLPQTPGSIWTDDRTRPHSLRLNHWTVLRDLVLDPRTAANGSPTLKGKVAGMYLAVLPGSSVQDSRNTGSYSWDGQENASRVKYGDRELPRLPRLDVKRGNFVAE